MSFRVAINGYGRIGQSVLRALYSDPQFSQLQIVAINELTDIDTITYLTRYDTTHGRFPLPVENDQQHPIINGDKIRVLSEADPKLLPWKELDIDLVLECSGSFCDRASAQQHLNSGAKRLLFSQPAAQDIDANIVYGVNNQTLKPEHQIVSNASCTSRCWIFWSVILVLKAVSPPPFIRP